MNDSIPVAGVAVALVIVLAVYVWLALGLAAVFAKAGQAPWKGWVPILNEVTLLQLGGFSGWLVLLALIPVFGPLFVYVASVVACHRINVAFDRGAGFTVIAALLPPVWASVLGFGSARWVGQSPAEPGPRRSSNAASDEFMSLFGAVPVEQRAPLVPPAAPQSETHTAEPPAPAGPALSPSSSVTPPPPYVPPTTPSVAADADAVEGAAVGEPDPLAGEGAPAAEADPPVAEAHPPIADDAVLRAPHAATSDAPTGSEEDEPVSFDTTGFLRAVADAEDDDFGDSDGNVISAVPPARPEPAAAPPYTRPAAWAQRPAPAGEPDAQDDASAADEGFPEASGFVSAVAGAPAAGSPRAASSSVSAQFVDAASEDEADFADETVIARRRRVRWVLHTPARAVELTSDVVIVGRRPVPDPAHPGAQLVAIEDDTKTVSKTHARLTLRSDTWYITDLGSTNGVLFATVMGTEVEAEPGVETEAGEHFLLGDAPVRLARGDA